MSNFNKQFEKTKDLTGSVLKLGAGLWLVSFLSGLAATVVVVWVVAHFVAKFW